MEEARDPARLPRQRRPGLRLIILMGLVLSTITISILALSGLPPLAVALGIVGALLVFLVVPDAVIAVVTERRRKTPT